MKKENKSMKNKVIERIVINAIIISIIAVMSFVPQVGYITIGVNAVSITTIPIAVLLFAWMFGWKEGAVAGLAFGVFSMVKAFAMPAAPSDIYFQNPFVSVFPRLIFGFISGIVFDLLRLVKRPMLRYWMDVIVVPFLVALHTTIVLVMFSLFSKTELAQIIGLILILNAALEMVAATLLVPMLILALDKAFPKYEAIYHGTVKRKAKGTLYDTITEQYHGLLLENLKKFVAIDSVYDEETVSKKDPFGKGVSDALTFIANLAEADGFKVNNYANKVVEITSGEGKNITILAHADVVQKALVGIKTHSKLSIMAID